ncbi:hypothetical protein D3C87_1099940 [compost metagenome]
MEKWIGQRFIFLPRPTSLQPYGYQDFSGGSNEFGHPTYEEAAGKIGTVRGYSIKGSIPTITIEMAEGSTYEGKSYGGGSFDSIALVRDFDLARSKWLGKKLWIVSSALSTYDADTDKLGEVKVKRYSPVHVTNIVAGWYENEPVRFVVKSASGVEGFVDVQLSGTNVPDSLRDLNRFDEYFLETDPRKKHNWPEKIWKSIENSKVSLGMTREQATFSWGTPKSINKTHNSSNTLEQWVYGDGNYLYFRNGKLVSIQN